MHKRASEGLRVGVSWRLLPLMHLTCGEHAKVLDAANLRCARGWWEVTDVVTCATDMRWQVTDLVFEKTKSITEIKSAEDLPTIDIDTVGKTEVSPCCTCLLSTR